MWRSADVRLASFSGEEEGFHATAGDRCVWPTAQSLLELPESEEKALRCAGEKTFIRIRTTCLNLARIVRIPGLVKRVADTFAALRAFGVNLGSTL